MLEARNELRIARSKVAAGEWGVLTAVGVGREYFEIAGSLRMNSAATRVRVMRLRRKISAKAA
jgi:hypothetical protein